MPTAPFGVLLTGGTSTRMGTDKASMEVAGVPLARRVADALAAVTELVVEVGDGTSGLPAVREDPPGTGPLAAVATGWQELVRRSGEKRPVLVVACDLPEVTAGLLGWLAAHRAPGSVVPMLDGFAQPLCARWSVGDLEAAVERVGAGERSLRGAFGDDAHFVQEPEWRATDPSGSVGDVDTEDDLARRALAPPPEGDDWIGLGRLPLPTEVAMRWATLARCGALVTFTGTVRDHAEGRHGVDQLVYEAYEGPALERMAAVVADARRRWPALARVAVLHRVGPLSVCETAVVVVVSAGHRGEAFAAGGYVIDTVKETVPIWKYEHWQTGADWGTGATPVRTLGEGGEGRDR